MSQKAVTSLSFSVKKKEPIRVVQKNSLEQTTKKSASTSKKLQEKESAKSDSQVSHSNQSSKDVEEKDAKKLETDAIEEILKDTKRGATRAEISGSWLPPKKVNSRLVNNTLVQALQSNRRRQMKPKKLKT